MTSRAFWLSTAILFNLYTHATAATVSPQASFQAILSKLDSAEQHKNANAWGSILRANSVPYFKMHSQGQPPANIAQTISNEKSFLTTMQSITHDHSQLNSFDTSQNLASADVTADQIAYVVDDSGQLGKPGALHKFEVISHEVFALILDNGVWKIQTITATPQTVSIDGHTKSVSRSR